MEHINGFKAAVAAVLAALTALWGWFGWLIVAWIMDLLMGQILANLPSVTLPFTYTVFLCPLVVVWYILTEAGSIVENAGSMGAPVPEWLKKAIAALKDKVDENAGKSE